ncbi:MAG TPA: MoaD/ThiS family protein [Verrucomicrobiae bacterium]|nr:MoaD/ThiS family protein [Verrucomicrobiae bacterium]
MAANIIIPSILRSITSGADTVAASGTTIGAILEDLDAKFPGIKSRLCDDSGKVRPFINIYINGEDIRFLQHLETPVKESDEISIVPAIAGG